MADLSLETLGVSKAYQRGPEVVQAVDDVTVAFPPGTMSLIVGPSGSGKTTLLNIISGWEEADSGEVQWGGQPRGIVSWHDVALVPQRHGLLPTLTVMENVTLADRIAGHELHPGNELAEIGLGELADALPTELSMGQQQRTAIARALAAAPKVLIADEPTSSQDEENARLVLDLLRGRAAAGSAVVVASHDPIAVEYADVVLTMRDGVLTQSA